MAAIGFCATLRVQIPDRAERYRTRALRVEHRTAHLEDKSRGSDELCRLGRPPAVILNIKWRSLLRIIWRMPAATLDGHYPGVVSRGRRFPLEPPHGLVVGQLSSLSSAFASFRSGVPKPSVNPSRRSAREVFHGSFRGMVVGEDGNDCVSCFHLMLFQDDRMLGVFTASANGGWSYSRKLVTA